jgi:CubicO group peptidase (beta-lactamase class C family)
MQTKIAIKEDSLIDQIDSYCVKTLREWNVPGAAVAIVKNGEVIFEKGYGTRKYGDEDPINPLDLFPIASISKSFAAASVALLVDEGKIKWTDRVVDYLPEFTMYDPWVTREFQIVDLLIHRSGLYAQALEQMAQWGYESKDIKKGLAHVEPATSFRSTYAYTNSFYLWVEDLVERISGQRWGEFVKDRLCKPLGMEQTATFNEKKDQVVTGHILDEDTKTKIKPIAYSVFPSIFQAAGGLVSSVRDLSQWMLMQLGHKKLISKENMDYMHNPHMPVEPYLNYGVGWKIIDDKPYRIVSHGGLIKGIKHRLLMVPKADAGIVVLTTLTDSEASMAITDYFADCVMGINPKDYSHEMKMAQVIELPIKPKFSEKLAELSIYEGVYRSPILGKISVEGRDGSLLMTLGPKKVKAQLDHVSGDVFSVYFLGDAGAAVGEGNWGTASFCDGQLILKGYESFENERFVLEKY